MPRGKPPAPAEHDQAVAEQRQVAVFLRGLAARAEADPALAAAIYAALEQSGLLASAPSIAEGPAAGARSRLAARSARGNAASPPSGQAAVALDPFVVYREHGEAALRTALEELDMAALHALIRARRLDPARISARWTAPERLVALIVQQVQARASIGRAFAKV
jgi:hypothetical protein